MATVQDQQGRSYDALQLTGPGTVNGAPVRPGWWVVTDRFGRQSVCSPESFPTLFINPATGGQAIVPAPAALPVDQLPWTLLVPQTLATFAALQTQTWTVTGAAAYRQIAVDVLIELATGAAFTVSVARQWSGGNPVVMDEATGLAQGQAYSRDFGEATDTGRALGAPTIIVSVTNTAGAATGIVALTIAGR